MHKLLATILSIFRRHIAAGTFLFLVILMSAACVTNLANTKETEPSTGKMFRQTLLHDGIEREYFVYLPSSYNDASALPLVWLCMAIAPQRQVSPLNPVLALITMLNVKVLLLCIHKHRISHPWIKTINHGSSVPGTTWQATNQQVPLVRCVRQTVTNIPVPPNAANAGLVTGLRAMMILVLFRKYSDK